MDNLDTVSTGAKKNKNLVLTVVNGVAKWVDISEATERFTGLRQERLSSRFARKSTNARYSGELE